MSEQTFILGKDAALETSIANFQQKLTQLGFNIEEASWLNPVPNVWSVHIRDKDCPQCFANGKGASQKAALASALGEFFERLSTNYFFADFYLGQKIAQSDFVHYPSEKWFAIEDEDLLPEGILNDELLAYFDPENQLTPDLLIDLQSGNEERGIVALPYVRQSDGEVVYIPQSIIANLFVSNGMSAGNTKTEARVQGLSEVFERYVKNRIIREAISLPRIPDEVIAAYPKIAAAIKGLEEAGFPIYAYDASLGGEYPVICVVLLNPENGSCFASFGAHPNFEVAFERTVTELLQGRSLKDLDVFAPPSFDNAAVAEDANLETHFIDSSGLISWDLFKSTPDYPFVHWNFSDATTQGEFNNLMAILFENGMDAYIMDYDHLGVSACRILVPGMSEIYPVDDLIYANNNAGLAWREILLDLPHFHHDADTYQELLDELDAQDVDDATRVREFIGIVADKDSGWANLRVGELKAMLYLALGDLENAATWVEWTRAMSGSLFNEETARYYRALQQSLALFLDEERNPAEYRDVFEKMYGKALIAKVWDVIEGRGNPFYNLIADDEMLTQFKAHQKLLAAYEKLQRAKKA